MHIVIRDAKPQITWKRERAGAGTGTGAGVLILQKPRRRRRFDKKIHYANLYKIFAAAASKTTPDTKADFVVRLQ